MTGAIDRRLEELGVTLPAAVAAVANYVPALLSGSTLYVSGQLPFGPDGALTLKGTLGAGVSVDDANSAARLCAINVLAQAKAVLGDLDRIARVVKITGFIASTADFAEQSKVMNGASDILVEILGDKGRHARSSVGVAALPLNAAVEVEAIIEVA